MKRLLLAGMGLFLVNVAQAANWNLVVNNSDQKIYVDQSSLHSNGRLVKFWAKSYNVPHTLDKGQVVAYTITLNDVNCVDRSIGIEMLIDYSADASVITKQGPVHPAFSPVAPETKGETLLRYACKTAKLKSRDF